MEPCTGELVVRNNPEAIQTPGGGLKSRVETVMDTRLRAIRKKIDESEKNGIDKDAGGTIFSILYTTRKVVNLCTNHSRLARDFSARFNIEDGVVSRKSGAGFVVARDPVQMANNFAEISGDSGVDKASAASWMIESSLTNLITWIGLAAEANPAVLREINNELDISKFGLSIEVTVKNNRERIVIPKDGKIPESQFSERLRSVRQEIIDRYGEEVARSILICGGSVRSLVMQEDPLDNYGGDIDYAVAVEIPEETRKGINEIFSKYGVGEPDDLTDPELPFAQNMQREGFRDIYDAIRKDPAYSIDKIAVNIATGEIFDPYEGLDDLRNGKLRLVGENLETKLQGIPNSKEAIVLAFRGARLGAQYAMKIDSVTKNFFKSLMQKNKFINRFHLVMRGIDTLPFFSEVGKTYLKMLEKTRHAVLIPNYLEAFGLLEQVSRAVNFINFMARLMWGNELRTIDDLVWERNYKQLAQESMTGRLQEGEDLRFTGKKYEQKVGPIKFVTSTLAISRMFSYLLAGI